ncbi:hypothetical protein Dimus_035869, partial [Dionaea muscipula]
MRGVPVLRATARTIRGCPHGEGCPLAARPGRPLRWLRGVGHAWPSHAWGRWPHMASYSQDDGGDHKPAARLQLPLAVHDK